MVIFKDYFNLPNKKSSVLKYMYGEKIKFFFAKAFVFGILFLCVIKV